MINKDFISTLVNVSPDRIDSFDVRKIGDTVEFHIRLKPADFRCTRCGGHIISHGYRRKVISHPSLTDFRGRIIYSQHRYLCKECGITFCERNPFSLENFTTSIHLRRRVMTQLRNPILTVRYIAEENGISSTMVNNYLDSYVVLPPPSLPENIGIDELSSSMSSRDSAYLCVLVDNEHRDLLDILRSRSKSSLSNYFSSFPREERERVRFVTIDMWRPYRDVCARAFPNAHIAVDPFHVVENLTMCFSRLRIDLMNVARYGSDQYYLLKKWHWLMEKEDHELDGPPVYNHRFGRKLSHRQIRDMIFAEFPLLEEAYDLKELYRDFNRNATYEQAEEQLNEIIGEFEKAEIRQYDEFLSMMKNWRHEIVNSFERPYEDRKQSNSLSENVNSRLRKYINVSNGVSNFTRFRKRALYCFSKKTTYIISNTLHSDKRTFPPRGKYNKSH